VRKAPPRECNKDTCDAHNKYHSMPILGLMNLPAFQTGSNIGIFDAVAYASALGGRLRQRVLAAVNRRNAIASAPSAIKIDPPTTGAKPLAFAFQPMKKPGLPHNNPQSCLV